jgi:hypothetical protein
MWCDGCKDAVAAGSFVPSWRRAPERIEEKPVRIVEAHRPAQEADLTVGIRALVKWCDEQGIAYETASGLASTGVRSVCFRARMEAGHVFVAYEDRKFARSFVPGGVGDLTAARRALGQIVPDRKPRVPRAEAVAPRSPAGKTDTLR